MIITRYGKCVTCKKPCVEKKEFIVTIDMFNPTAKVKITGELKKEIKEWRDTPQYCKDHVHV